MTYMINSENMTYDLSKEIDTIINSYNSERYELVECVSCNIIDINNKYNFNKICWNCNEYLCINCYNNESIKEEYICNDLEKDIENYICYECGSFCECGCEEYYISESFVSLMDVSGEYIYYSGNCCNSKGLDLIRKKDLNNNNYVYHLLNEFIGEFEDYINCADCNNKNFEYEFIGDDEEEYGLEEEDMEDNKEYEKVLNDDYYFYNVYNPELKCLEVVCGNCCDLDTRHF